jgi:hypothetical protein
VKNEVKETDFNPLYTCVRFHTNAMTSSLTDLLGEEVPACSHMRVSDQSLARATSINHRSRLGKGLSRSLAHA